MSWAEALKHGLVAHGAPAMEAIGRGVGEGMLPQGGVVALYGSLGVGKTTLARGLAQQRGVAHINSPSFNYYFFYPGARPLLHLDAYRLERAEDFPSLMIDELLTPGTLWVVEWPEKLGDYLPASALRLELSILSPGVHGVKLVG